MAHEKKNTFRTFEEYLSDAMDGYPPRTLPAGECQSADGRRCSLCSAGAIEYGPEYGLKNSALGSYWASFGFPAACEPLVPSPLGRFYRTVSKRKIFYQGNRYWLGLIGVDADTEFTYPITVGSCALEPAIHGKIYRAAQSYLERKENQELASLLQYIIVKGNYTEYSVIINLLEFGSAHRQNINTFSKYLTSAVSEIAGVFVFIDEERSQYYLSRPKKDRQNRLFIQKIFGKALFSHTVAGKKFLYSPLSFSQTNHSLIEKFVEQVGNFLELGPHDHLLDLYSGYGLFSLCLAEKVRTVTGVEIGAEPVRDAKENAKRMHVKNCTFIATDISEETLARITKIWRASTKLILDPPRNGTKPGVIEFVAAKRPVKVVHIFCNLDIMPSEFERWASAGYQITKAVPFDMFPGTAHVEMMVMLERRK